MNIWGYTDNWYYYQYHAPKDEKYNISIYNSDDLKEIWSEPWKVMDKYKKAAAELDGAAWEQLGSWIMSRNTIYNYLIFFVQYLSQLGLIAWVLFIIYAWYKYMTSVFTWKSAPTDVLSNAIIWVLIVIFSYAITKLLISFTWLS